MTIKQQGGIFGRNPTFNEVEAGDLTVRASVPTITIADTDTTGTHTLKASNANLDVSADPSDVQAGSGIRFFVDGDEKVKINSTGNLVISNAGNGIDFSATSGTGTSELFNDYEEGTWTPTLNAYDGTPTVSGYYVKIGQMVYVECSITLDGTADASGYIIAGLPFTMASPYLGGGAVNTNDGGVADALVGSDASGRLRLRDSSNANQTYNSIGASSTVTLNAQYRAA